MGCGRQGKQQRKKSPAFDGDLPIPGHALHNRVQPRPCRSRFDTFAEKLRQPFSSDKGRPSIPAGRYFRTHGVLWRHRQGAGIECRCADSLSLRDIAQPASLRRFRIPPRRDTAKSPVLQRSFRTFAMPPGSG